MKDVLKQLAMVDHFPLRRRIPLPTRPKVQGSHPSNLAKNATLPSHGSVARNPIAQNGLGMMAPPPGTLNPASISRGPPMNLPSSRVQPRSIPEQQQARREGLVNSFLNSISGIERAQVMASGFCDIGFMPDPRRQQQSVQATFSAPLAGMPQPQSPSLGQQQQMFPFPFGPTDSSLPPRRDAIDLGSALVERPIFEGDGLDGSSESDNKESDEQEDSPSSDATNKADMHDENKTETDDPSVKPEAGLDTMTTVDGHPAEWKNEWGVEPSEFENAFFAETNGDGNGRSLEEILNSPEHSNQNKRSRD